MTLEPKGKPSSPFTKPHSSYECRRERIYWLARAHCILLGLKSETCFFSPLREALHLYSEFNPHSSNIYTAFTEISVWKRLFCAARKFIVGLQLQIQLSRLGGKANAIFSKRGLILFGNHFNAWSFSCHVLAPMLSLQKLVRSALVTFIGEVGAARTVYGFVNGGLPSRIEFHFIEKNKRPSGGSEWEEVLTPAYILYLL